jgi:hypothetical protein
MKTLTRITSLCIIVVMVFQLLTLVMAKNASAQEEPETISYQYLPISVKSYPRPSTVFGVETSSLNPDLIREISTINSSWQRSFVLDWSEIEPVRTNPPTYDWSSVDVTGLQTASEKQVRILATVKYTPTWARKYADKKCGPPGADYIDEFAQFMAAVAARYNTDPYNLHYYEIGNEVDVDPSLVSNDSPFGCWGDINDRYYGGGYYADILKQVTPAIKAVDPQAQVFTGGLLLDCDPGNPPDGKNCKPARFLEGILRNGGGPYFDGVSYHVFASYNNGFIDENLPSWGPRGGAFLGKASFLREVLAQYGVSKNLFVSETSMTCPPAAPGCTPVSDDFLQKQANYVVWLYTRAWNMGLQGAVWYTYEDSGWKSSGLHIASVRKPAYYAYAFMANYLADATLVRQITGFTNITAYEFRKTDKRIWAVWSTTQTSQSFTLPVGVTGAFDIYGNPITLPAQTNVNDPIYLELVP